MLDKSCSFAPSFDCISQNTSAIKEKIFFPTTRYYGSKKRLLEWLKLSLDGMEYNTVLDAFGGTATVSLLFKSLDKKVFYNDILKASRLQAEALLSNNSADHVPSLIKEFCERVAPRQEFICSNFKGVFYPDHENEWLDGAIFELHRNYKGLEFSEVFYCLQQACIQKRPFNLFHRKNLYLRENNNKCTKFGNWATWERSFSELMIRASVDLKKTRYSSPQVPEVLNCTDAIQLASGYDLVYLDPPYVPIARQDVSYLERYHFLEGMADPDSWSKSIDWSKPSRSFVKTDAVRNWNTKSTFKDNLFDLVLKHSGSKVVLSYVDGAHPSLEEIERFFSQNFRFCRVHRKSISHALSSKTKTEALIIGIP